MSIELLAELNPEALTPDGLEAAYIGFTVNHHHAHVAVYSIEKCIDILMTRDGMSWHDADECLSFNTLGAFAGENGPLFVTSGEEGSSIAAGAPTLTDEERAAISFFAELRGGDFDSCLPRAATLRRLLERLT